MPARFEPVGEYRLYLHIEGYFAMHHAGDGWRPVTDWRGEVFFWKGRKAAKEELLRAGRWTP